MREYTKEACSNASMYECNKEKREREVKKGLTLTRIFAFIQRKRKKKRERTQENSIQCKMNLMLGPYK